MTKYYLYARKSTEEEDRQVLSLESQLNELREYAKRENLEIVDELIEAKTAKTPGRSIFNIVLKHIEDGEASGILAWHPDRLARNSIDGGRIIYLVDTGKITELKFPTYRFDNSAQGKFMLSIAFGQSKYYIDNLSENVKRGIRQKLRRGEFPGKAPLGYINDRNSKTILPDPNMSILVRKMFEVYSEGSYSLKELTRKIKQWGIVTKKGKPVQTSIIHRILMNPFYYGVINYDGELYEGSHPPIISKKLFDKVQKVLATRGRKAETKSRKFSFTGLIKCGECDCMITAEVQKGHTYYHCTRKKTPCSQKKFLREESLLSQVDKAILEIFIDDEIKNKMINRLEETADKESKDSHSQFCYIKEELQGYDQKIEALLDLYIDKKIGDTEYQKKKAKFINEKLEAKNKLDKIENRAGGWLEQSKEFISTCNKAGSVVWQGNAGAKRNFLKNLGSNFILKDQNLLFTYSYPFQLVAKNDVCLEWQP